jgi:hypothetical protein
MAEIDLRSGARLVEPFEACRVFVMLANLKRYYADRRFWEPVWLRRLRQFLTVAGLATVGYVTVGHPSSRFFYLLAVFGALVVVVSFADSHYRERWCRGQRSSSP